MGRSGSARLLGEDYFHDVRQVELDQAKISDAWLSDLEALKGLLGLSLDTYAPSADAGLVRLKGLRQLQTLDLSRTQVGDAGVMQLAGLARLTRLDLSQTRIGDVGLAHLKGLVQSEGARH